MVKIKDNGSISGTTTSEYVKVLDIKDARKYEEFMIFIMAEPIVDYKITTSAYSGSIEYVEEEKTLGYVEGGPFYFKKVIKNMTYDEVIVYIKQAGIYSDTPYMVDYIGQYKAVSPN